MRAAATRPDKAAFRRARLQAFVDEFGKGDKAKAGRVLGHRDGAYVGQMIRGERAVSEKLVEQIESMPGYAEWFGANLRLAPDLDSAPDRRGLVPLISWVQAGTWRESPSDAEIERWLPCIAPHGPGTYALRVKGDSMTAPYGNTRTYPAGCIIFVDPEKLSVNNGDRVIAALVDSNEVTFKVYKEEDGSRWLQPLNPVHLPIRGEFRIVGAVIGKWEDE